MFNERKVSRRIKKQIVKKIKALKNVPRLEVFLCCVLLLFLKPRKKRTRLWYHFTINFVGRRK